MLRSWDRSVVPYPFTRAIFVYGDPIPIPRKGDLAEWRAIVEQTLNDLAELAEQRFDELWKEAGR